MLDEKGTAAASLIEGDGRRVDNHEYPAGPFSLLEKTAQGPRRQRRAEAYRRAIAILLSLRQRFPQAICRLNARRRKPLKVGIDIDILAAMPELAPVDLNLALSVYTTAPAYLEACTEGAPRIDLAGQVVGHVSTSEAEHAKAALAKALRRQEHRRAGKHPPPTAPKKLSLADLKAAALTRKAATVGA